MVVKVYVSGISGNKEVKKRQQRVLMILDSKNIKYDVIDITEPGREADKDFMQNKSKSNGGTVSDPNPRSPLPPQLFNDDEYCGDYDLFDLANEVDTLEQFLKVEVPPELQADNDMEKQNGDVSKTSHENSQEREATESSKPENEKQKSVSREATPTDRTSKEVSPAKDGELAEGDSQKEISPERQKSVEKDDSQPEKKESPAKEVESKISKENTPEIESVNENGTISSRDQSAEKEVIEEALESKKDPSELLIQSEQTAAAE